jgi:hypothetical protein
MPAENPTDRSAMRELANQNARQAIEVHSRKRLARTAWGKLILACVSIGASLAVVEVTQLRSAGACLGLLACLGVAGWWTRQFWRMTGPSKSGANEARPGSVAVSGEVPAAN